MELERRPAAVEQSSRSWSCRSYVSFLVTIKELSSAGCLGFFCSFLSRDLLILSFGKSVGLSLALHVLRLDVCHQQEELSVSSELWEVTEPPVSIRNGF